ncbi:MAG: TonB-dependent receptor [Bacteroidetes bacterium]|jgi:TonB-linked SusC/RagA family outer membrane protein|nr:TonB-dependent receptor [Bacteroidota bacterium]MDA0889390.1 TonB-dependent receptor [Bacteroidota bacterium]
MHKQVLYIFTAVVLLFLETVNAQGHLISGTIVDAQGISLPGVTVLEQDSANGVVSDLDGNYILTTSSSNATLVFSYIGFETKIIAIANKRYLDVILSESAEALEEVQVVAFQKQRKNSVIGSINTIKPAELNQPNSNLTASLAGRISGVISYQRSGEPGADNAEFFVRGVTSFGYSNSPLILIDGLEVTTNDLARIEPDNIASFSVMKDATATSLYGARGANGVILVTTKEGKKGKAKVAFRYENKFSAPTQITSFLDGVSYMELYNSALRMRDPSAPLYYSKNKIEATRNTPDPNIYPNLNWYDELFKNNTINKKFNLNVNGGGDVSQYYLSVSHTNDTGLLKVDPLNNFNNNIDINRSNLRANVNINLTKTTKISVKFNSFFERYNGPIDSANDIFGKVMQANPVNFPKYYTFDNQFSQYNHTLFGNKGNGGFPNPYADMVRGYKDRFSSTILSQVQIKQELDFITEGLSFRALVAVKSYSATENQRSFNPFYYGISESETELGLVNRIYQIQEGTEFLSNNSTSNAVNSNYYYEFTTQYDRFFNDKHQVGGLLVFNFNEALNKYSNSSVFASLPARNMGISGRGTYGYDDRYFAELNFGYNGSEKFAKDHRFGFFPSAGLGWIVSNESFFEKTFPSISLLKLKYTFGLVGNDNIGSSRFFYLSDVNLGDGGRGYAWGADYNNYYNGYNINSYPNADVTWEVAEKTNYGVELGIKERLVLQFDYFIENRKKIYEERPVYPDTAGLTSVVSSNSGQVQSKGLDIAIDYNQSFANGFYLTARGTFTYATNEVVVKNEPQYPFGYLSAIGYHTNQPRGYIAERLFIDQEDILNSPEQFNGLSSNENAYLPGDIKYKDLNGDGKISELDKAPIGDPFVPEIVYGFGASMGYKNIDFSFFFQGAAKSSFFIQPTNIAPFINERNALNIISDNHWSENNPDPYAFWPRLSTEEVNNNNQDSTWWLRDGDFLRLKSIELGYTLPEQWLKIKNLRTRFYASGLNLFTISKFNLWDNEMGGNGLGYPPQRVMNLGLQINF